MTMSSQPKSRPRVLVLGSSGTIGSAVLRDLTIYPDLDVVRATRDAGQAEAWRAEGKPAVVLDLDDPQSFPAALQGVDRLFIMTGYTISMVHQVKTIVDAAVQAGVGFVVHLGVFGDGRSTDPHYAWHELVERYIEGSGLPWCHVHPNFFMENLLSFMPITDGAITWPMADREIGWVAGNDIGRENMGLAGAGQGSEHRAGTGDQGQGDHARRPEGSAGGRRRADAGGHGPALLLEHA